MVNLKNYLIILMCAFLLVGCQSEGADQAEVNKSSVNIQGTETEKDNNSVLKRYNTEEYLSKLIDRTGSLYKDKWEVNSDYAIAYPNNSRILNKAVYVPDIDISRSAKTADDKEYIMILCLADGGYKGMPTTDSFKEYYSDRLVPRRNSLLREVTINEDCEFFEEVRDSIYYNHDIEEIMINNETAYHDQGYIYSRGKKFANYSIFTVYISKEKEAVDMMLISKELTSEDMNEMILGFLDTLSRIE